jgi:AAA family ATP:ADP antiporter
MMRRVKTVWKSMFDVRRGEYGRTFFMALYLLFVLFAYYILWPVSRAMFLSELKIDRLPVLCMWIAVGGGMLAYAYSKLAIRMSLPVAVAWTMAISVLCLVAFWWIFGFKLSGPMLKRMLYVFNVWVSLFSIVTVSQGWLVAANIFDARSAKRLYGLLGLGAVLGAWLGGTFTSLKVNALGSRKLVLASGLFVILAYAAFRCAIAQKGVSLARARAAGGEETTFALGDILKAIGRHRQLQLIVAIITLMFVVDTLVDYQFQAMATAHFAKERELAAFLGKFKGLYLNLVTFPLQFLLTAAVVRRLGVGGTLLVMPVSIAAVSIANVASPGLGPAMATRLTEASTRYTLNKTGLELLYLPLPAELRNRTKVFVDIFMDRMGRGLGGALLWMLPAAMLKDARYISLIVIGFTVVWMLLSWRAKQEYFQTVRARLNTRRLELDTSRVPVSDPAMVALLEEAAGSPRPRQACYALSLLAEAPGHDSSRLLRGLANSAWPEVRGKVYEVAWFVRFGELGEQALSEVRSAREEEDSPALKPAVVYALSFGSDTRELAKEFLQHANPLVVESALVAIRTEPDVAQELISYQWLTAIIESPDARRRRLAAFAISIRGDEGTEAIHRLLEDPDSGVAGAACRTAGALRNRAYLGAIVRRLADPRVRASAIEALASYRASITGALGDILEDATVPITIRRQVPRVLKMIPDQRNVDLLLRSISHPDLGIRVAVLKALNRLRDGAPDLNYGETVVTKQIQNEARHYFELHAIRAPLMEQKQSRTAAGLLVRTLEERCNETIERLFRLLGLRYPQKEIYAAYRAVHGGRSDQMASALEFLENLLDRPLRRTIMPMLDSSGRATEHGKELFGVPVRDAESATRELIRSGDPWLAACAITTAVEQKLRKLAPDIAQAGERAGTDVSQVARAAAVALA